MPVLNLQEDNVLTLPYIPAGVKHQCIYWDDTLKGFGVRVYPTGFRIYVCTYRVLRRKRLASLGRVDALTFNEARIKALGYFGKAAAHEDPQDESFQRRSLKTVGELCALFIEFHAKKKRLSWKSDQSCLTRRIMPTLKHRPALNITAADIVPIHAKIGAKYPYAANGMLRIVRTMFNWGRTAGFLPSGHADPVAGIARFPERKRKRYITTVEMPQFIQALEAEDSEYARHGLWLLLLMGLRSKELLKARWTDVDWEMSALFVGLTKNGEPLLAPISEAAMERLKAIPRIPNNPYILCGRKQGQPLGNLGPALRRVLRRAGLENVRVHDLRRTVGSWLAHAGHSLHLIGDVLNHRDLKTTAGYAYFQTQQRRDALTGHGNKVLALATSQIRVEAAPRALAVEDVLQPSAAPSHHRHYFKREALHELVWTAPVSEVANRLGVSNVGLTKLCRRAAIPTPGRGYWARVEAGLRIDRKVLPPAPDGLPNLLRIRGRRDRFAMSYGA